MPTHSRIIVCQKARRNWSSRTERGHTHHTGAMESWREAQHKLTERPHSFTGLRGEGFQAPGRGWGATKHTQIKLTLCVFEQMHKEEESIGKRSDSWDIYSLGLLVPAMAWTKALLTPKLDL